MDILNFISWLKNGKRFVTSVDPTKALLPVGQKDGRRDDDYLAGAMTLTNAVQSGNIGNTKHYELDITATSVVTVDTPRGIIDILGMGSSVFLTPDPAYASSVSFIINNPDLDLTAGNKDNIYVQYSVYYSKVDDDNTVPYLIATGVSAGLGFKFYNANPTLAGAYNWYGELYVYYELYTIN